jgi:hypothetical protein
MVVDMPAIDLDEESASAVEAGERHTCVVMVGKTVGCWGDGSEGALGYANSNSLSEYGDAVPGGSTLAIGAGEHTCALSVSGSLKCWGKNGAFGSVGKNSLDAIFSTPSSVEIGGDVDDIAVGRNHTCVIMSTGDIRCWGRNDAGQLGYGHINHVGDNELPFSANIVELFGQD